jgi:hypothetical protein
MPTDYTTMTTLPDYQIARFDGGKFVDDGTNRPRWGRQATPPAVGARVRITMNRLGAGIVTGYFVEANWLGLLVQLDNETRPEWHRQQNGPHPGPSHIFGPEFEPELK